jgi:hypothetical protein
MRSQHGTLQYHSTTPSSPRLGHGLMELVVGDPTMTWRVDPSSAKQGSPVDHWPSTQSHDAAPHHTTLTIYAPPRYTTLHYTTRELALDVSRRLLFSVFFFNHA